MHKRCKKFTMDEQTHLNINNTNFKTARHQSSHWNTLNEAIKENFQHLYHALNTLKWGSCKNCRHCTALPWLQLMMHSLLVPCELWLQWKLLSAHGADIRVIAHVTPDMLNQLTGLAERPWAWLALVTMNPHMQPLSSRNIVGCLKPRPQLQQMCGMAS